MFNTIAKCLEANTSIVGKILDDLVLIEPTAVSIVESLRQIPVVERLKSKHAGTVGSEGTALSGHVEQTYDEGGDAISKKLIDDLVVEIDSELIDRVVP